MNQTALHDAVARATGETVTLIRHMGFQHLIPRPPCRHRKRTFSRLPAAQLARPLLPGKNRYTEPQNGKPSARVGRSLAGPKRG
jgi:hypothetical protein